MTTQLVFSAGAITGLPVVLVFGDEPEADVPAVHLTAAGAFDLQPEDVADLTGTVSARYFSDAARPLVADAQSLWQRAQAASEALTGRYSRAAALPVQQRPSWQEAVRTAAALSPSWSDAARAARAFVRAGWHEAQPLRAVHMRALYEEAIRLRGGATAEWREAVQLANPATRQGFQDADRTCRRWVDDSFTEGWRLRRGVRDFGTHGVPLRTGRAALYQEAWPPRPGRWVRPVQPPVVDPCYLPELPVRLVFSDPTAPTSKLIFFCERHAIEPGGTIVVPIRRVYMVLNETSLRRVEGDIQLPTFGASFTLDAGSFTWGMNATLPADQLPLLEPVDDEPVEVELMVNGVPYRFLIEARSRERMFGQSVVSVTGRGLSALLDAPYVHEMSFGNTANRTAQQLMGDVLTLNGISLGWDVEWGLLDWTVPAGVWQFNGTYIAALGAIAQAAGGYLQPDPLLKTIRVLARYPEAPWNWGSVTPDFEVPSALVMRESMEWTRKPKYNRVYVAGTAAGSVRGNIKRDGTAGEFEAPMIVDSLITEGLAAFQRGRAVLSDTGNQVHVPLRLPVLPETGIIVPGKFVDYVDAGVTRRGLVRSVQVDVGMPEVWQNIGVETHVS